MNNPICLSPLKFYDSLAKQERYKSYAYGHISPMIMPLSVLYPFQFVLPKEDRIVAFELFEAISNEQVVSILESITETNSLSYISKEDYDILMFSGAYPITEVKQEGLYYIKLGTSGGAEYYSEIFCFTANLLGYIELEYWNPESDFNIKGGAVSFDNNFRFKMLLRTELGKPEYSFEEEATKRLGYTFIESQVSKKIYHFNALLPEYMCDALRLVRLCSNKTVTTADDKYELLSFDMDVDWQDQGDLASVACEFEVDNVIINLGDLESESAGQREASFNNDFSEDFD